ncbi:hypothetical protein BDY24DRAFT_386794 [Mrakia frigida]|uniref:uncharacterized protein n=1 Tax=Mrakia frigida TaxID=29902 RepID=UPI003FCC15F5
MRRRQAAPPAHAYPTYPEERKPVPTTPYVGGGGGGRAGAPSSSFPPRSYLPNHPSSGGTGGAQHYSGGDVGRSKTFVQTATLHGKWAWKGLQDACKVKKGWDLVSNDARLRGNLIKSLLLNIPFLLSLLFLSFVLLPLLSKSPTRSQENPSFLSWLLRSPPLWQLLGTGGVVLVNGVWQGKIAERAWGLNSGAGGGAMGVNGGAAGGGSL